jgi:hypothetical protein
MTYTRTALAAWTLASVTSIGCGGNTPAPFYATGESNESPQISRPHGSPSRHEAEPGLPRSAPPVMSREAGDGDGRGGPSDAPRAAAAEEAFKSARPEVRPGLATQWGETRASRVTSAPFARADLLSPFAMGKLFYNDRQGIEAMSSGGRRERRAMFTVGGGFVELGLRDEAGRFISGFSAEGSNFLAGMSGQRYSLFLKNRSPGRLEVVASVDGLDVIDGQPASFDKRGYLLDSFGELEIEGFRTSTNEVAAFRFGSVEDSYAERKHGDSRNVGVIGIALFNERGDSPSNWRLPNHADTDRRHDADPFPMRFAMPPR